MNPIPRLRMVGIGERGEMSSRMGSYDHVGPLDVPLDLDFLADHVVRANYGVARLLAALVRARRRTAHLSNRTEPDRLVEEIERLLNEGAY